MQRTKIIYEDSNGKRVPLSNIRYGNDEFRFFKEGDKIIIRHICKKNSSNGTLRTKAF